MAGSWQSPGAHMPAHTNAWKLEKKVFRSSGQTTNEMVVDLVGTQKRPATLTIRQEQRPNEREW